MITVEKCTKNISIQDLGRPSAQHLGFSTSGAADEYSFLLANLLLENQANTPAFEIFLGNVTFKFNQPCTIMLTGADCHSLLNNRNVENNQLLLMEKGDVLQLRTPRNMLYTYLSVQGGFDCNNWLGSASYTHNEHHINGHIPPIYQGQAFTLSANTGSKSKHENVISNTPKQDRNLFHQSQKDKLTLRFIPSNLFNAWTKTHQHTFLTQTYQVSTLSDKMGYRLTGEPLEVSLETELSKPVTLGTIQLPPDGQPIILMKARQTIGGYPVLGVVIYTDVIRLSQKRPGEQVNFNMTPLSQAQAQLLSFRKRMGLT
ncbi:biotin-dependent carboxyltransferase family protein [Thalassotalea sp. 1_MG-2023]|uniref:5-oxoprolinase subunit C family protein n=1 Tax=Thalassotalea sp. 1_MG-2023 TaxID=3062680 RepID=UPI0026E3804C|nr:biotin-dependent carboxyltransferase family protein [Thalassotalea sp. 1_MG-2023]MDO6425909.1 biotin-dependent carboxyltransferase family protein [Thalassotalea sp. 1_MG-2023]